MYRVQLEEIQLRRYLFSPRIMNSNKEISENNFSSKFKEIPINNPFIRDKFYWNRENERFDKIKVILNKNMHIFHSAYNQTKRSERNKKSTWITLKMRIRIYVAHSMLCVEERNFLDTQHNCLIIIRLLRTSFLNS